MTTALDAVTITSPLHSRTFHRVRIMPYVRKDGTETTIAIWCGACVVCGAPFEVATPAAVSRAEESHSFGVTTCPKHRLTRGEVASMWSARMNKWHSRDRT
jgi:hypothetical protein